MAIADWELNLFATDPRPLEPLEDRDYERGAAAVGAIGTPVRLKLLHAVLLGEQTPMRAAAWAGIPQTCAERELRAMAAEGVVERELTPVGPAYRPADGHVVALVAIAVAHGAHRDAERPEHPLLLRDRRRIAGTRVRDRE